MFKYCNAPGCGARTTSRFSNHCAVHRARLRRHGSIDQRAVTKADLKPFVELARSRIKKNAENPIWNLLESRWEALLGHAESVLAYYTQGHAGPAYERRAAQEIIQLKGVVDPREVVETVLAIFMMQELDPRRFRSDAGF